MEHMTDLKELNGGIAPRTIPQVVIEEELVGGYNDVELKLISLNLFFLTEWKAPYCQLLFHMAKEELFSRINFIVKML